MLLTTHAMDEAEQLCDRVAIITGGKLAAFGSPADLTRDAASDDIWFAADPDVDCDKLARALGVEPGEVVEERAGEYVVRAAGTPARIADLACFLRDHDVTLGALQSGRRSLEEVFLQITAEEAHVRRQAVAAQARAESMLQLRQGENLIVTLAIPLGILVFFAKVDAVSTDFAHPVDFLVPGVLSLAVMAAAMVSLGIATGFERRYGVLKRLGSTPLSRGGLLIAKTATVLALEIVQVVLVVIVGVAIGWHVSGGIVAAIGLLLLGTIAFAGIGL